MISWRHETPHLGINASRSHPGTPGGHGQRDSWSLDGHQDCCPPAGVGRSTPRMDNRGAGVNPHELESLDAWSERSRHPCAGAQTAAGSAAPLNSLGTTDVGSAPGAESTSVRSATCPMGWAHAGDPSEAGSGHRLEGAPGADVDASTGLPPEAGRVYLPAGPIQRHPSIPAGVKKNSTRSDLERPSSFKMRPDSPCIPAWGEGGQSGGNAFGFPPPANIKNASMSRGGWRPCWVATG